MMLDPAGPVDQVDVTTPAKDITETMMMGMRLNSGVSLAGFNQRFGTTLDSVFPSEILRLTRLDLIEISQGFIRLSDRGRLLGNEVFAEFVVDEQGLSGS